MGLGAGMNLIEVAKVGTHGFAYTFIGISFTLLLGCWIAKLIQADDETSMLISVGTAICGGSAIAAVAPVIGAKSQSITVALGVVFILNAVALILFPILGHELQLSQSQFGLWSALAIHDTSSVVGATLQYGSEALKVGTTVKLSRALWIVLITPCFAYLANRKQKSDHEVKQQKPWFILGFLVFAAIFTYIPTLAPLGNSIEWGAKRILTLTLFLIGSQLSLKTIKTVGARPIILGVCLWICVASASLISILHGWIEI